MRKIASQLARLWRWIEGIHTLVWIVPIAFGAVAALAGVIGGIHIFWILTAVPIAMLCLLLLSEKLYWHVGFIPLSRASVCAFDRLIGTRYHRYACNAWPHPERRQEYVATAIATYVPLYGVRPPGERLQKLPNDDLSRGGIRNMGSELWYHGASQPTYVNLSIERRHLRRAVNTLREAGEEFLP